jgi:Fe-S cluster biogenesis protein NfuA
MQSQRRICFGKFAAKQPNAPRFAFSREISGAAKQPEPLWSGRLLKISAGAAPAGAPLTCLRLRSFQQAIVRCPRKRKAATFVQTTTKHGIEQQLSRMEELVCAIDTIADKKTRAQARELVGTLLELHGTGIERGLELIYESDLSGPALIDRLAQDNLVSHLLLLHGLHPLDLETRVRRALDSVKPRLGLHGGDVDLVNVTADGAVRLRLEGNCHGCPSSRMTLKSSIEEALYAAAPDITALEVDGAVDRAVLPADLVPKFTECPQPVRNGQPTEAQL